MGSIRRIGDVLLWVMAVVGAITGLLWIANAVGLIQPLVVVSESMQPSIRSGDLLVAFPVPVEDLAVGDVASLPSSITGNLMTHRVITVSHDRETVSLQMQGDDNDAPDGEIYDYAVGETVLHPMLTIPGAGTFVTVLALPAIGIPLFVAIASFIVLAVLPSSSRDDDEEDDESSAIEAHDVTEGRINA